MSGTTTTSPTAAYVDANGIHAPAFQDILTYLIAQVQAIFGSDVYLGNDSQDGQLLGIFAQAVYDTNSMAVAVYNAYSPTTAIGVGLSSMVKINGLARELPSNSSVVLTISGTVGTVISNGSAIDSNNNQWLLPNVVIIPSSGQINVNATAAVAGNITAAAGSVTRIQTPVFGWQTVTNSAGAVPGLPLESDSALRVRQTFSTMLPSLSALDGLRGAVLSVTGVTRATVYENATSTADSNGVPGHSIAFVVEGGDATVIATAIAAKKTPGCGTYGSQPVSVYDAYGVPHTINFSYVTEVTITIVIHLTALPGYTTSVGTEIINSLVAYINALPIGSPVYYSRVIWAALSVQGSDNQLFNLTSLTMARDNNVPTTGDIAIAFSEAASLSTANVTISIP